MFKAVEVLGMSFIVYNKSLRLIELKPDIEGFTEILGAWLLSWNGKNALIDVGPDSTAESLLNLLSEKGINRIDYIFLTHIHLDHGGGTGTIVEEFPHVKVVCHERGIRHLVDPSLLWMKSKKVLGEVALKYGEPRPVPQENISNLRKARLGNRYIRIVETLGHAPHHQCYVVGEYLFSGDAAGVYLEHAPSLYLRPTTPPVLYLEEALKSIDKLIGLGRKLICFGHFGMHRDSLKMLKLHRQQLLLWRNIIDREMKRSHLTEENLIKNCAEALIKGDPLLKAIEVFPEEVRRREEWFIRNSVLGFMERRT